MITFIICLALLVAAYFGYGAYLDRVCQIDGKADVPSKTLYDGVDYIPMPRWRTFLIQLLNIAGVGPIFGAIMSNLMIFYVRITKKFIFYVLF